MVKRGQKWSQVVKSGQKWPKFVQNWSKIGQKLVKNQKFFQFFFDRQLQKTNTISEKPSIIAIIVNYSSVNYSKQAVYITVAQTRIGRTEEEANKSCLLSNHCLINSSFVILKRFLNSAYCSFWFNVILFIPFNNSRPLERDAKTKNFVKSS